MRARIYKSSKSITQQNDYTQESWLLEFDINPSSLILNSINGWFSNTNIKSQILLRFPNKESGIKYAIQNKIKFYIVNETQNERDVKIFRKYLENFENNCN